MINKSGLVLGFIYCTGIHSFIKICFFWHLGYKLGYFFCAGTTRSRGYPRHLRPRVSAPTTAPSTLRRPPKPSRTLRWTPKKSELTLISLISYASFYDLWDVKMMTKQKKCVFLPELWNRNDLFRIQIRTAKSSGSRKKFRPTLFGFTTLMFKLLLNAYAWTCGIPIHL